MVTFAQPPKSEFTQAVEALRRVMAKHGLATLNIHLCGECTQVHVDKPGKLGTAYCGGVLKREKEDPTKDSLGNMLSAVIKTMDGGMQKIEKEVSDE
jgi:hypothetical protein